MCDKVKRLNSDMKKRVDFLNENGYLLPREYLSKSLRFVTNDIAHIASSLAGQLSCWPFFLLIFQYVVIVYVLHY